jgi:hypothetical protein
MSPRLRAFLVHLAASAAAVVAAVLRWWYPGPMLSLQGGMGVMLLILSVDLILGPALTGLVYQPGKKSLKFDLSMIVLFQVIALAYGVNSIKAQRPVYLAFTFDRFFVVSAADAVGTLPAQMSLPNWRGSIPIGTAPVTALTTSKSLDELEGLSENNLIPPLAIVANEIQDYPARSVRPTTENGRALAEIPEGSLRSKALVLMNQAGLAPELVRAYRVVGRRGTATALVELHSGRILDIVR